MKRAFVLVLTAAVAITPAIAKQKTPKHKAPKLEAVGSDGSLAPFLPPPATPENTWDLDLSDGGRVVIQLRPDKAPQMVERIKTLTHQGFYNGLMFHRVIDGFMAQGGDPKGTGEGGSTLPDLPAEFNDLPHVRGAVAAARASDENSANSQFYVMFQPNFRLDKHYTVFGRVITGMPYVDAIQRGDPPPTPTHILRAVMGDDPAASTPPPAMTFAPSAVAAPTLSSGPIQPEKPKPKRSSGPVQPAAPKQKTPKTN